MSVEPDTAGIFLTSALIRKLWEFGGIDSSDVAAIIEDAVRKVREEAGELSADRARTLFVAAIGKERPT